METQSYNPEFITTPNTKFSDLQPELASVIEPIAQGINDERLLLFVPRYVQLYLLSYQNNLNFIEKQEYDKISDYFDEKESRDSEIWSIIGRIEEEALNFAQKNKAEESNSDLAA